jgi:hypothetical protein
LLREEFLDKIAFSKNLSACLVPESARVSILKK